LVVILRAPGTPVEIIKRLILVRELSPKLVDLVRALTRRADSFATVRRRVPD
jgi:hypothetical protein